MAKKIKNKKSSTSNKISYDKLRDELFDYRIDIKSYKRNLNTIIIASSLIISVVAFFGYNKIENIEKSILERANNRLAITDSILAKIDKNRIDSLNLILIKKEKEYELTISNFERIIAKNKKLEMKLLTSLPENEMIKSRFDTHIEETQHDFFEIKPFNKKLKVGTSEVIYLVFKKNIVVSSDDYISLSIFPKGRNLLIMNNCYKINTKFNKLSFKPEKYEKYRNYILKIGYLKKTNNGYVNYILKENIIIE